MTTNEDEVTHSALDEFLDRDYQVKVVDGAPKILGDQWLPNAVLAVHGLPESREPPSAQELSVLKTVGHDRGRIVALQYAAAIYYLRQFLAVHKYCSNRKTRRTWLESDVEQGVYADFFHERASRHLMEGFAILDRLEGAGATDSIDMQFERIFETVRVVEEVDEKGVPDFKFAPQWRDNLHSHAFTFHRDWRGHERETGRLLHDLRAVVVRFLAAEDGADAGSRGVTELYREERDKLTGSQRRVFKLLLERWPTLTSSVDIEKKWHGDSRATTIVDDMRARLASLDWEILASTGARSRDPSIEGVGYLLVHPTKCPMPSK